MSTGEGAAWPTDAKLLPLGEGRLLVSRDHARFCRVPADGVAAVEDVLSGRRGWDACDPRLLDELRRHGFGEGPSDVAARRGSVLIQLTNRCNLGCSYCCTNSRREAPLAPGVARRQEITYEDALTAVRAAREVLGPGTRIGMIGGEPLLVPWALELAEAVIDLDLELNFSSNGTALEDESIARRVASLIQRGAIVRVSLAGVTRERCDHESRGARFDATIAGIHALARFGALPVVDVMLFPEDVALAARELPRLRRGLPAGIEIAWARSTRAGASRERTCSRRAPRSTPRSIASPSRRGRPSRASVPARRPRGGRAAAARAAAICTSAAMGSCSPATGVRGRHRRRGRATGPGTAPHVPLLARNARVLEGMTRSCVLMRALSGQKRPDDFVWWSSKQGSGPRSR